MRSKYLFKLVYMDVINTFGPEKLLFQGEMCIPRFLFNTVLLKTGYVFYQPIL